MNTRNPFAASAEYFSQCLRECDAQASGGGFQGVSIDSAGYAGVYISVPIKKTDQLHYNDARYFRPEMVVNAFDQMELKEYIVQKASGEVIINPPMDHCEWDDDANLHCYVFLSSNKTVRRGRRI